MIVGVARLVVYTPTLWDGEKMAVVGIDNDMRSWFLWRGWQHRGVTGPQPSAVELHGYLSYIVMCAVTGREYTIYGYKGKAFSVMRCPRAPEASGAFDRICSR